MSFDLIKKIIEAEKYLKEKKAKEQRLWKKLPKIKNEEITELKNYEEKIKENFEKEEENLEEKYSKIEEKIKKLPQIGIGKVSPSKITTYKGCPFAYYCQYVIEMKPPFYLPHIAFGEVLHAVIRDFNLDLLKNFDELINGKEVKILEKNKIKKKKILGFKARWFRAIHSKNIKFPYEEMKYKLYYEGVKILQDFYEKNKDKEKPFFVEKNFDVVLDYRDEKENLTYEVIGIFDRVDVIKNDNKTKVIITDYKTRLIDKKREIEGNLGIQFTLYKYAYLKASEKNEYEFPKPSSQQNLITVIYGLKNNEEMIVTRNKNDLRYVMKTIKEVDEKIKKGEFTPFIGKHCWQMNCVWIELCNEILKKDGRKNLMSLINNKPPHIESLFDQ